MTEDLTARIIGCIIRVHGELGPGFLESIYSNALMIEFRNVGISAEAEKEIPVFFDGEEVGRHRVDVLVESAIVLELKAVEKLHRVHYAQVRSYLNAAGLDTGLLVNFSGVKADFRRVER